ncbi:glycosyltransferase family 39 protein [Novosphingopyxis sp.]|uniref:glycosyltransferase family 39 protein n=1 Tax=Novosphingopyxis sp. TaxID=2709690 RepID=UPI003B5C47BE
MTDRSDHGSRHWTARLSAQGWATLAGIAAIVFFCINIQHPHALFFDETYYVPAARNLIDLSTPLNQEHPPFAKCLIALGITIFGDDAWGWRLPSALFGGIALFGALMFVWELYRSARIAVLTGIFLIAGHLLFIQSRIAMLDIFMAAFLMLALWQIAAAVRATSGARKRLAWAGAMLGLSIACKWTAAPYGLAIGVGFLLWRGGGLGRRAWNLKTLLMDRSAGPVRGVSLLEAGLLLGLLPAIVYLATFIPMFFFADKAVPPADILSYQWQMAKRQSGTMAPHPYSSVWWQWIIDERPIWYLYEQAEGAIRGVLLLGNPIVMWAGLPALILSVMMGVKLKNWALFVPTGLWLVGVEIWIVLPKKVTFYHHYLVPSFFLIIALAATIDYLWLRDRKYVAPAILLFAALAVFVDFYPILSAMPLSGSQAFNHWMWLPSWR